ncbi:long-chain-fatty-acid--CoA ligase FadD17 [Mycolicibacterium neworleansense]|uniref:Acyl-CoA synthetase n=1 Tax=Mycolicibacterium neworleansense TaxID=146018 RepID=A0A0H5SBZ0_9MYCO|nr:long-chain-fatty-acid--CoA ligase FadD17 [Mycolicibacterium neworleansense]MCV7363639.1 AMP-binding protein [Mycolicibacterium neworleansense]CRZ18984.1 acyl-CoA synthetase [Mycolicibacterium neworleansense]
MGGPTVGPTVTELLVPLAEVTDRGLYQEDSFVSWADHIAAGAALAAALRARLDPTKPPHVGALLGNTTFFSSLLVAAGLSGLVPVGLNQTRRGEALARDIGKADCQLVLADDPDAVPPGVDFIDVESADWAAELASYRDTPVTFAELSADDLFMLIFTSGTSGDPKAVRVTHDKVAFPGRMLAERFGLGPADTVYLSMPLFHSNAIMAGWAVAAAAGASIALRRKFSASGFMPDIRRYGATYANYVGKPLSYILATEPAPDDTDNPLRILYGNEGAPRDLVRFAERFGVTVVDGFGSSEGGVAIARTPDTPEGALGPLTDQVAIVDVETGEPCPPGVVGELVNPTGPGWFRGYYNDPDAEAARMAGGVYHTGDLAYLDEDGFAHFAGRLGDWMRVDGENLGTAPIERILLRHPDIAEVAVYPIPDPAVGDQVMAALVLTAGTHFDADKFRAFLAEQSDLGPKQWPSYVRVGPRLPRTETFKVIKRQLSAEGTDCTDPVWPISR